MSAPEYPASTMLEMAAIPEEALPRFLAELPAILAELRPLAALYASLPEEDAKQVAAMVQTSATWVDDDKGNLHTRVELKGEKTSTIFEGDKPLGGVA